MNHKLTLYSRQDCCLCDEMKKIIREVAVKIPIDLEEVDIDASADLREKFGDQVPVLFVDNRKSFKYRVTARELKKRLKSGREWRLSLRGFGQKGREA
jgi:glutaredoxin